MTLEPLWPAPLPQGSGPQRFESYGQAVTTPPDDHAQPVPVRVVLPADPVLDHPEQEVVARLWKRRQTETGWLFLVGLPSYRDREDGDVEAAEYRV